MEFIFSGIICLLFTGMGFAAGMLLAGRRGQDPAEEQKTEEQEKLDRQWEDLFRFDGRNG